MGVNKNYNNISFCSFGSSVINELARYSNTNTLINFQAKQYNQSVHADNLDMATTSLNWPVHYMCRIQQKIIKPVLITEEGGEKLVCYPDACTLKGMFVQNTCAFYLRESN